VSSPIGFLIIEAIRDILFCHLFSVFYWGNSLTGCDCFFYLPSFGVFLLISVSLATHDRILWLHFLEPDNTDITLIKEPRRKFSINAKHECA
jgi:hypothetical protein